MRVCVCVPSVLVRRLDLFTSVSRSSIHIPRHFESKGVHERLDIFLLEERERERERNRNSILAASLGGPQRELHRACPSTLSLDHIFVRVISPFPPPPPPPRPTTRPSTLSGSVVGFFFNPVMSAETRIFLLLQ